MTQFELVYRCAEPFLPPLYRTVRRRLRNLSRSYAPRAPELLDVGGRKSHYTIGIPANVTVTELRRTSQVQVELNLGLTDALIADIQGRRSNLRQIIFDDMTCSALSAESFDLAVAIEVLEHVEEDRAFVSEVRRVLRPGGVFLMTTPNGDMIPVPRNPDHKRHYTRRALGALLATVFEDVEVEYAVVGGKFRGLGLRSWSIRHPARTVGSMTGNLINAIQSARAHVPQLANGTRHLIAVARRCA